MIRPHMTAEVFAESRYQMADGGRGCELHAGEAVQLDPPSRSHGTVVLNFSKALAEYQERNPEGYACFELGLIVARNPDTVFCPPISYFVAGDRWAEMDNVVTESKPALVVEIVSSDDRRRRIGERVRLMLESGIAIVLIADPDEQSVVIERCHQSPRLLSLDDDLASRQDWISGPDETRILPGFRMPVADVFREPEWMT